MKTWPLLLITVGVLCSATVGGATISRAVFRYQSFAEDRAFSPCDSAAVGRASCQAGLVTASAAGETCFPANGRPAVLRLRPFDPQPDKRGQADDAPDNFSDMALASSLLSSCSSEWRKAPPEAQSVNSFVHSKTKPPP